MNTLLWLPCATLLTLALTGVLRHYARSRLLDVPGARSSHRQPTPRGAGVALAAGFLLALVLSDAADAALQWALVGAGIAITAIGFADDHRPIAPRWRLLVHAAAALWALWMLGGAPAVSLFGVHLAPGWVLDALSVLALVWMLNLYNFMDGIDALAGSEAITTALGGALLLWLAGEPAAMGAPLLLAAASLGFLAWNLPPARIFLGDSGSGFLGLTLGVLALSSAHLEPALLWSWLILLGVFVVDASLTLVRRAVRGEALTQAHRSHAYQRAARRWGSHGKVSTAVAAINLLWLLPCAALVACGLLEAGRGLLLAYAPLALLAWRLGAGLPDSETISAPGPAAGRDS